MVNVKGKGAAQGKDTEVDIKALRIGMLRVQGILDYIFASQRFNAVLYRSRYYSEIDLANLFIESSRLHVTSTLAIPAKVSPTVIFLDGLRNVIV